MNKFNEFLDNFNATYNNYMNTMAIKYEETLQELYNCITAKNDEEYSKADDNCQSLYELCNILMENEYTNNALDKYEYFDEIRNIINDRYKQLNKVNLNKD